MTTFVGEVVKGLFKLVVAVCIITATTVSAWILGMRQRRRIKRALGVNASDSELVSLNTWMQVEDAEQKQGITDGQKADS